MNFCSVKINECYHINTSLIPNGSYPRVVSSGNKVKGIFIRKSISRVVYLYKNVISMILSLWNNPKHVNAVKKT